jgi:heme/copper-type cytochrome/quinol oxidase subunit 4
MGRFPSKSGGAAYCRLQRRLLRPTFTSIVINKVTVVTMTTTPPPYQYVQHLLICLAMVVVLYASLLFMLLNTSSMSGFQMLVIVVVMFYILELITKIMHNYLTIQKTNYRRFPELSMVGFADALRPIKITDVHFKRW